MSTTYPVTLDAFSDPTANTTVNAAGALAHHTQHANANDAIAALETYLGTNASQTAPAANQVLAGTGAGVSSWSGTPTLTSLALLGNLTLSGATRSIWTSDANELDLGANSTVIIKLTSGGGAQVGAPTGGDKGAGTLNATNLYVNGTAVSTSSTSVTSASADVTTSETTTSTSYADLTTPGPAVTLSPGATQNHLILHNAAQSDATGSSYASVAIAGAAAADVDAATSNGLSAGQTLGRHIRAASVANGSTHTMKYRVTAGTGTFVNRRIAALSGI